MKSTLDQLAERISANGHLTLEYCQKKIEVAKRIVSGFLESHPKKDLYPVTFCRDCDDDDTKMSYLIPLEDDELNLLHKLEKEFDAPWEEEEFKAVNDRILEDAYSFLPLLGPTGWYITGIKSTPEHSYRFTVAVFDNGPDVKPIVRRIGINLSDDDYSAILVWKLLHSDSGDFSFNLMRKDLPDQYQRISSIIEKNDNLVFLTSPYVVFMDEVDEDYNAMKGEWEKAIKSLIISQFFSE